ncbi:MAG: hypothetical protein U0872_01990 [Planctomycetaceae bacterium]
MSPRSSEAPAAPGIYDALLFVSVVATIIGIVCIYLELAQYAFTPAGS